MTNSTCSIPGCGNSVHNKMRGWCRMHYFRWYRTGSPGSAARLKRERRNDTCAIDGCEKPDRYSGLCAMHDARRRRHGDPLKVIHPSERHAPKGEDSPVWAGDDAKYGTVHGRLRAWRGPAKNYRCAECGNPAKQWSYDRADPDERFDEKVGAPYSLDLDHYRPLCVPCHKVFDLNSRKGAKVNA